MSGVFAAEKKERTHISNVSHRLRPHLILFTDSHTQTDVLAHLPHVRGVCSRYGTRLRASNRGSRWLFPSSSLWTIAFEKLGPRVASLDPSAGVFLLGSQTGVLEYSAGDQLRVLGGSLRYHQHLLYRIFRPMSISRLYLNILTTINSNYAGDNRLQIDTHTQ